MTKLCALCNMILNVFKVLIHAYFFKMRYYIFDLSFLNHCLLFYIFCAIYINVEFCKKCNIKYKGGTVPTILQSLIW